MTAQKKSKEEQKHKLTVSQQKLVEALTMSKSIDETSTVAGYSDRTAARPTLKGIPETASEVLEGTGASIEYVVNNCLRPLMNAKETKFFAKAGIVFDVREVPALDTRIRALAIWAKLMAECLSQRVQVSEGLSPNFKNVSDHELEQKISKLLSPPRPAEKS